MPEGERLGIRKCHPFVQWSSSRSGGLMTMGFCCCSHDPVSLRIGAGADQPACDFVHLNQADRVADFRARRKVAHVPKSRTNEPNFLAMSRPSWV